MNKTITLAALAALAVSAQAATIAVLDGDFELNDGSWTTTDGAGINNSPSTYIDVVAGYGTGVNAHIKADGGNSLSQLLDFSDEGVMDATTFSDFTISLDHGQRQDAADSNIRIALWNTSTNTELAGVDQLITGAIETWTAGVYNLSYDNSAQTSGDDLEFRVTNLDPDLEVNAWNNTASIDNVSITATAAVPEPSSAALLGLAGLALILRRRK